MDELITLVAQGRFQDVEMLARDMVLRFPNLGFGWKALGVAIMMQGRGGDALAPLRKAAEILSDDAEVHFNLGIVFQEQGLLTEAEGSHGRALRIRPDYNEAHARLGGVLQEQGRLLDAEKSYRRALEFIPDRADIHHNLGIALTEQGRLTEAEECFRQALRIKPDLAETRVNLGVLLHRMAGESSGSNISAKSTNHTGVRRQYETLPFPSRNPEAEHHILTISPPDILCKVNQYCFGGARDFSKGLRVLVAGAGTGDSPLWLAHQLRGTPSEIVALDLSTASLEIAKARTAVHGFNNIQWVNASILDLPSLGLGVFDYITSLGVLHHLPDPEAGLAALETVLSEGGGVAVMLYGVHGRSHIYLMQDVLRKLTAGLEYDRSLDLARQVIATLPPTNQFRRTEDDGVLKGHYLQNDSNLWDTLLHERDRAYTASQVRGFMATSGLNVQTFTTYQGNGATCALQYDLNLYIHDDAYRRHLASLPGPVGEDLAEALDGSLALHTVYATRAAQTALDPTAPHAILAPMSQRARQIIERLTALEDGIPVILRNKMIIVYRPLPMTRAFLAEIDGQRSNAEIACHLSSNDGTRILELVAPDLYLPAALHWLVARTSSGTSWSPIASHGQLSLPYHHHEPDCLILAG
ncbi:MAG: tetratricopeptide repeat protein [Alphaproteobacteria bacterium]